MGRGIAHCFAYAGHAVRLVDAKPRAPDAFEALATAARAEIREALTMLAELGAFDPAAVAPIMARISIYPAADAAAALAGATHVFEGVPEVEAVKAEAFAMFDRHADAGAILASTTSTFLSTMLAAHTQRPQFFLNAHFLNPASLVPLVEVSPAPSTAPETTAGVVALLESIGKVPVVCKASPGYIVPRIQALAMNEAARMVEEGVASAEDIDRAIRSGFGFRFAILGLLEFIDWGGGDILFYASRYMAEAMNDRRFEAPAIVTRNMEQGRIGLRTGAGFMDYASMDVPAYRRARLAAFVGLLSHVGLARPPVLERNDPTPTP
jgi:3-hydroxybutyryl-CoA dehydrogenase